MTYAGTLMGYIRVPIGQPVPWKMPELENVAETDDGFEPIEYNEDHWKSIDVYE